MVNALEPQPLDAIEHIIDGQARWRWPVAGVARERTGTPDTCGSRATGEIAVVHGGSMAARDHAG